MSNLENAPITCPVERDPESPWSPPFFLDSDFMAVDFHYEFDPTQEYTIELQYPHIRTSDLPHVPSIPFISDVFTASTPNTSRPSIFSRLARLDADSQTDSNALDDSDTDQAAVDCAMRTPSDFSISPPAFQDAITPFGKDFELVAAHWITSGSYVSPVIHAPLTQICSSRPALSSPPTMSFLDRLQAHASSSFSPSRVPSYSRSPPLLLSPCKLTLTSPPSNKSANKENLLHAQLRSQYHTDAVSISPLTASTASSSRRPIAEFKIPFSESRPTSSRRKQMLVSPLTPLTPSPATSISLAFNSASTASIPLAVARKRRLSTFDSPTTRVKRTRYNLSEDNAAILDMKQTAAPPFTTRTLPAYFILSPDFPLFYRRFPASTYFRTSELGSPCALFRKPHPGGIYNAPRDAFDLYTPRFVKGKGVDKVGLCPICIEEPERGGEGKKVWLSTKFSAFKCYHMQYHHGVSASTARPLAPPTDFRVVGRPAPKKGERAEVEQGKCHKCRSWIVIETVKDMDVKVKELIWWKHAVACHMESVGVEGDVFEKDEVFEVLRKLAGPADTN